MPLLHFMSDRLHGRTTKPTPEAWGTKSEGRDRLARIHQRNRQTRIGHSARPAKNFSPSRLEIKKGRSLHQLSRTVNPEGFAAGAFTESGQRCHAETGAGRVRRSRGARAGSHSSAPPPKFTPLSRSADAKCGKIEGDATVKLPRSHRGVSPARLPGHDRVIRTRRRRAALRRRLRAWPASVCGAEGEGVAHP